MTIIYHLLTAASALLVGMAIASTMPKAHRYDCSMAAFHPDYPSAVKRKCREVRT